MQLFVSKCSKADFNQRVMNLRETKYIAISLLHLHHSTSLYLQARAAPNPRCHHGGHPQHRARHRWTAGRNNEVGYDTPRTHRNTAT